MEVHREEEIEGKVIHLDDQWFIRCTLVDCDIFYTGGYYMLEECTLKGCNWRFYGAAQRTMTFLQLMGVDLSIFIKGKVHEPGDRGGLEDDEALQ